MLLAPNIHRAVVPIQHAYGARDADAHCGQRRGGRWGRSYLPYSLTMKTSTHNTRAVACAHSCADSEQADARSPYRPSPAWARRPSTPTRRTGVVCGRTTGRGVNAHYRAFSHGDLYAAGRAGICSPPGAQHDPTVRIRRVSTFFAPCRFYYYCRGSSHPLPLPLAFR